MSPKTLSIFKILTSVTFVLIVVSFGEVFSAIMIWVLLYNLSGAAPILDVVLCLACLIAAGKLIRSGASRTTIATDKWSIASIAVLHVGAFYYLPAFTEYYIVNYITYFIFVLTSEICLFGLIQNSIKSTGREDLNAST